MRIISQDGYCDLPYEQTALCVSGKTIYADFASLENVVMAIYFSEEKAIKAMEMCREYYDSIFFEPQSEIFQFPKDEEVEDE